MLKSRVFWRSGTALAILAGMVPVSASGAEKQRWVTPEYSLGWHLPAIQAREAYRMGFTGAGVTVGVLDSGLDTRHGEFRGRVVDGYDFAANREITGRRNFEYDDHGTHVSGIIAANRDGKGMHGVAFNAKVKPVVFNLLSSNPDEVFPDAWRYLATSGVSIINNSIGANDCSEDKTPPCNVTDYAEGFLEENYADTIAALKETAANDVLMVLATGNEYQPAPDALAGMPHWVPELRDNWLAVGAIDADGELAEFSNRCGVAAEWCLVAPGVGIYSTAPLGGGGDDDPDYQLMSGTSMATPVVSGIAALVKEAFPFFTAKDLQQTLLTTAIDLGDPDRFGWGLVNANRAVKGYGSFMSDVVLDTDGHDATFSNDIGGPGSLTKNGAGSLTLSGSNSFMGGTVVNGGGLVVDGSLASRVDVQRNGMVRGTGTITAALAVAGRLAPGNSPGTLTVDGPVILRSSAVTQIDIDGTGTGTGAGNHSRLVATGISGMIGVDGTLEPVLRGMSGDASNAYVAPLGVRFDVIRSSAGLVGRFTSVAQPGAGLARATRFDTVYDQMGVTLVVTPDAYGDLAANGLQATSNENAVGLALDRSRPAAGARTGGVFAALYDTAAADLPAALGQLSGDIHASASAMQVDRAGMMRDAIGARFANAFRTADPAPVGATFWSAAYGGGGFTGGGDASRMGWSTANVLFGADAAVGDSTRIGVAAGTGGSTGKVDRHRASADARHYDVAIYGGTTLGAFEASYGASHSWSTLTTQRRPTFGGLAETLDARYGANSHQAFAQVGYKIATAQVDLTPFVSGAYMRLGTADFAERGGSSALAGTVPGRDVGVTVAGMRIGRDFEVGGGTLSATAMVGWQHVAGGTSAQAQVAFAGGTPFTVDGAALDRHALRLDLDAEYALGSGAKAGLGYRGAFGGASRTSSLRADLKLAF
jgi:subtilase-type serine protease